MYLYNLYDDWLDTIPSYTAFLRLTLLLRALHISESRTHQILHPTRTTPVLEDHIWPSFKPEQWKEVERALTDFILTDYCKRNEIPLGALTQSEIRDILLGAQIQKQNMDEREEFLERHRQQEELAAAAAASVPLEQVQVRTINKHGDEIIVAATSVHGQQQFVSSSDWRVRAIAADSLKSRLQNVFLAASMPGAEAIVSGEDDLSYILPKNLIKKRLTLIDVRVQVACLLYGAPPANHHNNNNMNNIHSNIREVRVIVIPAQLGSFDTVVLPDDLPEHDLLKGLIPLGWIRTQPEPIDYVPLVDLQQTAHYFGTQPALFMTCTMINNGFSLAGYTFTPRGFKLLEKYPQRMRDQSLALPRSAFRTTKFVLADIFLGFFLAPRLWNYHHMGVKFNSRDKHPLSVSIPKEFYHPDHRPLHFIPKALQELSDSSTLDPENLNFNQFDFDDFN